MPDYIEWYLVEIERHLRKIDPPQRVTDIVGEVRGHLEQSVEDIRSRGATEDGAVKEAIIGFGHPRIVAKGFAPKSRFRVTVYWAMIALTLVVLGTMSRQFVISVSDARIGDSPGTLFSFGAFALIGLGAVFLLSMVSKRWCVFPLMIGCTILIALSGYFVSGEVRSYAFHPSREELLLFDEQNARRQVSLRDLWLKEYDERIPAAKESLTFVHFNVNLIRGEGPLTHRGQYVYPERSDPVRIGRLATLPGLYDTTPFVGWSRIDTGVNGPIVLKLTESVEIASAAWRVEGGGFFGYVESVKRTIEKERAMFASPDDVPRSEIMKQTIGLPVLFVALYSLFGLLLNAFVLVVHWAISQVSKREWRRQFS